MTMCELIKKEKINGIIVIKINFIYKLNNYYKPEFESGIIFNDKKLKIRWPNNKKFKISKKDKALNSFAQFCNIYGGL